MKYFVLLDGIRLEVDADGIPLSPSSYWGAEILETIAALPRQEEPDPEPPAPQPDWTRFNLAIFSDPAFASWEISQILQFAIVAQATSRNLKVLQTCYNLAKAQIAPSAETIATWQSIADQYHIGLIL
jgi:hypothetical protein